MSAKRDRITTVLRVRRAQELQAAGELSRATAAAREAERVLGALRDRYDDHRALDRIDAPVPDRLRDHEVRALQSRAIQRGRVQVRDAVAGVDLRRAELLARTQAVRAMERLAERARDEDDAERRRLEVREQDERAGTRAARDRAPRVPNPDEAQP